MSQFLSLYPQLLPAQEFCPSGAWSRIHGSVPGPTVTKGLLEVAAPPPVLWQELWAEVKAHQGQVQRVLGSGQSLAASGHPQAPRVLEQCQKLEGRWAELERACEAQAQCLQQAVALQQVGRRQHVGRLCE